MPAEYSEIHILQRWMPYFMVGEKGAWQIYDIERHELVSEELTGHTSPHCIFFNGIHRIKIQCLLNIRQPYRCKSYYLICTAIERCCRIKK